MLLRAGIDSVAQNRFQQRFTDVSCISFRMCFLLLILYRNTGVSSIVRGGVRRSDCFYRTIPLIYRSLNLPHGMVAHTYCPGYSVTPGIAQRTVRSQLASSVMI